MIGGVTVDDDGRTTLPGLVGRRRSDQPAACTARIAWRRTACSKGWCTAPMPARRRRRRRSASPIAISAMPLENPPVDAADRAARPGRHPQFAQEPDVARRRRAPQRRSGSPTPRERSTAGCGYVLAQQFADPDGWELQNMLTVARVMIGAALRREESRGVHLRTDFPEQDDAHWQRIRVRRCSRARRRVSGSDVRTRRSPARNARF